MAFGKKNHVKVDPTAYNLMLLGEPKIGKTTVIKEALERLVGEEGYMFVELGREAGADAIEGINYINCPVWETFEDEDTGYDENGYNEELNAMGWINFVDDIVENKSVEYPNLKVLVMDTYDQYIMIADDEALEMWNKDNKDKKAKSLNGAWGGFGAGSKKSIEIMFEQIDRLEKVGVKVWWIGHVKNKAVTDVVSGESYEVLSSDQQQNYFNALKKNLHFLGLAYADREIIKEKTGKKNVVTKKEEEKAVLKEETRKISFRDSAYAIDCGSRFKDITPTIDLDADQLVDALKNAIIAEQSKSGKSFSETKAEQDATIQKRREQIAEAEEKNKAKKSIAEIMEKVTEYLSLNKTNIIKIKPILTKLKELGYAKPTDVDNIDDANTLLALIED